MLSLGSRRQSFGDFNGFPHSVTARTFPTYIRYTFTTLLLIFARFYWILYVTWCEHHAITLVGNIFAVERTKPAKKIGVQCVRLAELRALNVGVRSTMGKKIWSKRIVYLYDVLENPSRVITRLIYRIDPRMMY